MIMASTANQRLAVHGAMAAPDDATTAVIVILSAVLVCSAVFFGILKFCYGSFSLSTVLVQYKERRRLEEAYGQAYQRREEIAFHRDWAKSRGDFTEARRLEEDLVAVEAELDELDDKLGKLDGGEKYQ